MSFPRYESYKDIGVEWLGEVPEHWATVTLRSNARPGRKCFVDGDWIESPYITSD
jgi:type I restriction enzyme S subunit